MAETLRAIIAALKEELPKLSEAGCFRDYGRLVLTLDEMIYEVSGLSSGICFAAWCPASELVRLPGGHASRHSVWWGASTRPNDPRNMSHRKQPVQTV